MVLSLLLCIWVGWCFKNQRFPLIWWVLSFGSFKVNLQMLSPAVRKMRQDNVDVLCCAGLSRFFVCLSVCFSKSSTLLLWVSFWWRWTADGLAVVQTLQNSRNTTCKPSKKLVSAIHSAINQSVFVCFNEHSMHNNTKLVLASPIPCPTWSCPSNTCFAECKTMPHLAHMLVAVVLIIVFIIVSLTVTAADFELNPLSRRWLASSSSSVEVCCWMH